MSKLHNPDQRVDLVEEEKHRLNFSRSVQKRINEKLAGMREALVTAIKAARDNRQALHDAEERIRAPLEQIIHQQNVERGKINEENRRNSEAIEGRVLSLIRQARLEEAKWCRAAWPHQIIERIAELEKEK